MPDLPTWLIEILRQFPMVVVIGLAVWYVDKRVREKEIRLEERYDKSRKADDEQQDKMREEVRRDRDAEIQRLQEANARVLTAKDEQIANLTKEVESLSKQLGALTKKLSG